MKYTSVSLVVRQPLTPLSRDSGELVHPIKRRRQVRLYRVATEFARLLGIGDIRPDLVVRCGYAAAMPMLVRRPLGGIILA